jgi:hypothetical protein
VVDANRKPIACSTDPSGAPQIQRNPDGTVKYTTPFGSDGDWRCFNQSEQTAAQRCTAVCDQLDVAIHPDPGTGEARCRAYPLEHPSHGAAVHPGECVNDTGQSQQPLIVLPGPASSPDFDATLLGSGSVSVEGTTRTAQLERGYVSIKMPDPECRNLDLAPCALRLNGIHVEYEDFPFRGKSIRDLVVTLAGPIEVPVQSVAGSILTFSIPEQAAFHASGLVDGQRLTLATRSRNPMTGTLDYASGVVTLGLDFAGSVDGNSVSGTALATSDVVLNRPPRADAGPDQAAAATDASCAAVVELRASGTTDPEGGPVTLTWSAAGANIASGVAAQATLAIGSHRVVLEAQDDVGAYAIDALNVVVDDATLPEFVNPSFAVEHHSCTPNAAPVQLVVPQARNLCAPDAPVVSGRIIRINGAAVSTSVTNGLALLPAGLSEVEWTATNDNGSVTFVQTVELTSEPTLFASEQLLVGDRAQLTTSGLAYATIMSIGQRETRLGTDSDVGDVFTLPAIAVLDRSTIHGTLHHGSAVRLGNDVSITRTVADSAFPIPTVAVDAEFESGQDVHLEPASLANLEPGSFGEVVLKPRSRLVLGVGDYRFTALQLEPDSVLEVPSDGSAQVFVRDAVTYLGRVERSGGGQAPLRLSYLGLQDVKLETPFWGIVRAPNAQLVLETVAAAHQGRFYARSVDVRAGTRVVHDPGWCIPE